jgi:hypothetical protein
MLNDDNDIFLSPKSGDFGLRFMETMFAEVNDTGIGKSEVPLAGTFGRLWSWIARFRSQETSESKSKSPRTRIRNLRPESDGNKAGILDYNTKNKYSGR